MSQSLFLHEHAHFIPQASALSPWGSDRLHGGPVLGLLAHLAEQGVAHGDVGYRLTRLSADLFARVPNGPLEGRTQMVRQGRRMALLDVSLCSEGKMVARASALFSVPIDGSYRFVDDSKPTGPEELSPKPLIGEARAHKMPPGFHMEIETRFCPEPVGLGKAIWFHMPMTILPDVQLSSTVAAVALADFNNAVNSIAAYEAGRKVAHMNTDTTLYLERPPVGRWFAMATDAQSDVDGISVGQAIHYDSQGRFGRSLQSRLETKFN